MTIACNKHQKKPVVGYNPCPGCEVEWLKKQLEEYKILYQNASWHLKEMVLGDDPDKAWNEAQDFLNKTFKEGF